MTADNNGNDIQAVGIPVTGQIAFAPYETAMLTTAQLAEDDISSLMAAFTPLGLLKTDGGPQFAWAADGDPIEFWQEGYKIPSGLSNVTIAITPAETLGDHVRSIIHGIQPDAHGGIDVDGGGHATRWVVYTEEIFKSGAIRRRLAANVGLRSAAEDRSERGAVNGNALVFDVARDTALGMKHFREVVLPPESGS